MQKKKKTLQKEIRVRTKGIRWRRVRKRVLRTIPWRRKRVEYYKQAVKKTLPELRKEFPFVKGVYLFGSASRGKKAPKDIDVMLIVNQPKLIKFQRQHPEMKRWIGRLEHPIRLRAPRFAIEKLSELLRQEIGLKVATDKVIERGLIGFGDLHFDPKNPEVARESLVKQALTLSQGLLPQHKKNAKKFLFDFTKGNFIDIEPKMQQWILKEWNALLKKSHAELVELNEQYYRRLP